MLTLVTLWWSKAWQNKEKSNAWDYCPWLTIVFPSLIGSSVFKIKSKAYLKAKRTPLNKLFKRICTFEYCQPSPLELLGWSNLDLNLDPSMSFDVTEPFPRLRTDNRASGEEAVDTKLRLCLELALKGAWLCTRTGSKGPLNAGFDRTEVRWLWHTEEPK